MAQPKASSPEAKASKANIKTLEKTAHAASVKAARSGAPEDHKAAASAHREHAAAAEKHYYGFRSSRNTNENLHSSKQAAIATASLHDMGKSADRHIAAAATPLKAVAAKRAGAKESALKKLGGINSQAHQRAHSAGLSVEAKAASGKATEQCSPYPMLRQVGGRGIKDGEES